MKIISGTKTSEDVNRIKEKRETSCPPNFKRKNGKNDKNDKSQKSCLFSGGVHPFKKENAQHGVRNVVNAEEEITLQKSKTRLSKKSKRWSQRHQS